MPVLIFEKSAAISKRLTELIMDAEKNNPVFVAATFTEAVRLMQNTNYSTVLLNLHFPGNLSLELLKRIKINKPDSNVIIMYTYASECQLQQCICFGANHLVNLYEEFVKIPSLILQVRDSNNLFN